ncbi:acyltransferase family protein [Kitasatospora sp. NBC_01287]|uniref:lysophospholipid acyltransferase family protein n=1 Tax=Kitasatospora sp. NBC_01287 TaxID=2903573 RepID=UPI0022578102|nr:lysophospholipid acyltransferase family protein [Kitasatospora sp. NBC_01287]MCX4748333.1 acyltransferase family protein [Kitasatospora sp. NBC_01287]
MSAAHEELAGEAKVIPIESAPSWSPGTAAGAEAFAARLADGLGSLLSGRLGPVAETVLGKGWEGRAASGLAFLRRRITGDYEVDEFGFDRELTEEVFLSVLRPLAEQYFRVEVRGIEHIPAEGGALVVANHSGVVPLDALMTQVAIHDHHPGRRHLRMLAADLVFVLPLVGELARKAGHTLACNEDAQALLERGEVVGVWPEGFKGIGKPFADRYKLQRFGRGGFVASALRAQVPIVPCSIVGAEETYPMLGNVKSLARLLGLPYLPITPTFPWLGPLGAIPLPTKWTIQFGEPIRTDGYPPEAAEDPMLVFNLTDEVRETIQHTLYQLLVDRRSVFF